MKKWLSLALVAMLLAGCCSPALASSDKVLKIEFWHTRGSGANLDCVNYAVNEFNNTIGKEKGIEVEPVFQGDYQEILTKVQLACQTGTQPAISVIERADTTLLMDDGLCVDMLPMAQRDGMDVSNFYSCFIDSFGMVDGKLIALPYVRSTPVFYYNKTMADAKGLTAPATIEDLETFGKAMTEVDSATGETKVYGFELLNDFCWFIQNWLVQLGSSMLGADGTGCPGVSDGSMLKIFTAWRKWVDDGWCEAFTNPYDEDSMKEAFYQGKLGSFLASCGGLTNVLKYSKEAGFELGVAPIPTWSTPTAPVGGGNICIIGAGNSQEVIDAAWEFAKFLTSDEMVVYNAIHSGYLPTTKTAGQSSDMQAFWKDNPLYKVAYDQLSNAFDLPDSKYTNEMMVACENAMSMLIQEKSITPEEAVQQIADEAASIFAQ